MTLALATDHSTGGLGTLAGALPASKFKALLIPIAASAGLCPESPLFQTLLDTVLKDMDVVVGAPFLQDVTVPCDAMSLGISFEVAPVLPPTTVVVSPTSATKCADAGP
jgi:hypothetical protein